MRHERSDTCHAGVVHQHVDGDALTLEFVEENPRRRGIGEIAGSDARANAVLSLERLRQTLKGNDRARRSTTSLPPAAKSLASSKPMPLDAPVTSTVSLIFVPSRQSAAIASTMPSAARRTALRSSSLAKPSISTEKANSPRPLDCT